jgi:formate hydrogenlyase subunit 3/multisubunit Na+/H+ antiporter MnhD subunit
MRFLVALPMAVLLAGAVLQVLTARALSARAKGWLAFATSLVALAAAIALSVVVARNGAQDLRLASWDGPLALSFHVDGLSQLFALMGAGIGAAVLLFSVGYMAEDRAATRFYVLMLVFITGLISLVYARDLLLMYASWELVGLCSFLLVGFWYTQREAASGARKVLAMTHLAGYALLAAILILYARTGTTLWTDHRISSAFTTVVFVLMLVSAVAKSVQFPLHTWIPSAMAAPTPVSALLHAACYVKAGVYLVARMHSFAPWLPSWQTSVIWLGTATMLIGVLFAMVQHDSKKLLAFHTVSQIGYMMLGLGLGSPLGIVAGLLHCLNHGLFKGGLFLGAGSVQHATGTKDMDKLGGLGRRMPRTAVLWLISAASIAGVPLLNGFVSKWLLYIAALRAGQAVPALISWVVSIFTMFSFMKASSGMFFGEESEAASLAHESPRTMLAGSGLLALGCIVLGVAPQLAVTYLVAPAARAMGYGGAVHAGWLGITTSGGSWYASVGLLLAVVGCAVAGLVYWLSSRRRRPALATAVAGGMRVPLSAAALVHDAGGAAALSPLVADRGHFSSGSFTGGEPLAAEGRLRAGDFSASIRRGLAPFYDWADPDRYYLRLWRAILVVCGRAARLGQWLERYGLIAIPVLAAAIALAAGFAGTVRHAATPFTLSAWPIVPAVALALIALLAAGGRSFAGGRRLWLMLAAGAVAAAGLLVHQELARLLTLEAAAFLAFALLVWSGVERAARRLYLLAVVLSAALLVAGTLLLDHGPAGLTVALLVAGFALKLALVPAYLWLPAVAQRAPAALVGLLVAVVDVAAVGELIVLRHGSAWLFSPRWPWLALAVLSAVGGAVLALGQTDVKRLLAFSTITDVGFLTLGIAAAGRFGLVGATVGAAVHALAKGLLFTSVAAAEGDGPLTLKSRGVARRHPLAAAGFVAGSLAALGVPPTAGFAGHWRLYATAYGLGWPWLLALVFATALSVLAYVRVIAVCWWGGERTQGAAVPTSVPTTPHDIADWWRSEPLPMVAAIVGLVLAILAAGMWPRLL